jgi:phosphopantetheine adenylyltransferase
LIQKLGEDNLSKLSEIGLEDEVKTELTTAILGLEEAKNTPSIVLANKDAWHKETLKSFYDSDDALLAEHLDLLGDDKPDNTKERKKAVLSKYKEKVNAIQQELIDLKARAKDGISEADTKALIKDAEDRLARMKETHVPKEEVEETRRELGKTRKEIQKINELTKRDQLVSIAIKSQVLSDEISSSELVDVLIQESVNKYLGKTTFGVDNVQGELILDKDTRQLVLRQKGDNSMSIVQDGKVLNPVDLVKKAIVEYKLNKKGEEQTPQVFTPPKPTVGTAKIDISKLL